MAAPRKFDQETRERAVRMYYDRLKDNDGESKLGARRHVSDLLDITPATLGNWIDAHDRADSSGSSGTGLGASAESKALRKENAELRRANEMADSSGGRKELCELL